MAGENTVELASLRFEGKRFEGHALDIECTQELIAYRTLVLECAKELWRRNNPDRVRLPKRFEDGFRLEFDRIDPGSATIPLRRVRDVLQGELDLGDDFDEAAAIDGPRGVALRRHTHDSRFTVDMAARLVRAVLRANRAPTVACAGTPCARLRLYAGAPSRALRFAT